MGNLAVKDGSTLEYDRATLGAVVESLVVRGDVSALSPEQKARFYVQMCDQLGLNAATQPLAVLKLNGKEIFYPTKGATDQLAAIHKLTREVIDGPRLIDLGGTKLVYAVCRATHPNGRSETAVATVPFTDPANVLMKAETKCKRRATLSILGLGMLDESELETIPAASKSEAPAIDLSVLEQREEPTTGTITVAHRDVLKTALDDARDLHEVALAWIDMRSAFASAPQEEQAAAWGLVVDRAAALLKATDRKGVGAAVKAAIKRAEGPQPPPESSTGEHHAAPATDAEATAEREAIQAEGSSARAWIRKTLAGHHEAITHLVRSWLAHHSDFGAEHEAAQLVFVRVARESFGYGPQALERFVRDEAKRQQEQMQRGRAANHLKLVRRAA